jgi:hypothetical protein
MEMEMDIGPGVSIPNGANNVRFCRNEFECCTNY